MISHQWLLFFGDFFSLRGIGRLVVGATNLNHINRIGANGD